MLPKIPSSRNLAHEEKIVFEGLLSKLPQYQKDHIDKKGTSFTIRTARVYDMEQVINLEYDMEIKDYGLSPSYSKIKTEIKTSLQNTNTVMLVAEQDSKIVAFIWGYDLTKNMFPVLVNYLETRSQAHLSYLDQMVVGVDYRRQGIAGVLMDCYKEISKQNGVDELVLKTISPTARKLYEEKKHYMSILDPVSNREVLEPGANGIPYHFLHLKIK